MIVVKYEEAIVDQATGAMTFAVLGTESHQDIEEVLLPSTPTTGNPIFFTKKFVGQPEYRWEVVTVKLDLAAVERTYVVRLNRRPQIDKSYYLKNILAARRNSAVHILYPWAIVEVEFGHSLDIGKANGDIRSNKRYADTMQRFSMPKRRLAIVNQVHSRRDDLIQVIPISSRPPTPDEKAAVEVTSSLVNMVHYQKPSWAICRMMQTVTASRIIAPLIQRAPTVHVRDKGFRTLVRGAVRDGLKDAIMYGVAADGRVADAHALVQAKTVVAHLNDQVADLARKVADLERHAMLYERWAAEEKLTLNDLQMLFPDTDTP